MLEQEQRGQSACNRVRQDERKAMITGDKLPKPGHIGSKAGYGVLILTCSRIIINTSLTLSFRTCGRRYAK